MKVGDLVTLKPEFRMEGVYYGYGVIIMIEEYGASGFWYRVQWAAEDLWHVAGDLELANEDR